MQGTRKAVSIRCMSSRNPPSPEGIAGSEPVTTYRLAIGDRVNKMDDNQFLLVQSGITLIREPETILPS